MFDFYEQPWALLGIAVITLFGVFTYRSVIPEKRNWRQWLIPAFIALAGFGIDFLVKTDNEKIKSVIYTGVEAARSRDFDSLDSIISDTYRDSRHSSKEHLMTVCRQELERYRVEKFNTSRILIQLSQDRATATLFGVAHFHRDSFVSQNFKSFFFMEFEIRFQKQPDKSWLINRIELSKLDRRPFNWKQI